MRDDFEVTVRVRNNHLKSRRDELGFTHGEMAEIVGISKSMYGQLESLRLNPIGAKGHWRDAALALASFFNVMPEELFPPEVIGVKTPVATRTANASDLLAITNGSSRLALPVSDAYDSNELSACLDDALSTLTPREAKVISMRFYEDKTLEDVGCELFLTRESVRLVEAKALRRLRHPSRSKVLRAFVDDTEDY